MSLRGERMLLIGRDLSPFVRRTAIVLETLGLESERRKLAAIEDAEQPASSGCKAMQCHWPSCLTILENMVFIQTL